MGSPYLVRAGPSESAPVLKCSRQIDRRERFGRQKSSHLDHRFCLLVGNEEAGPSGSDSGGLLADLLEGARRRNLSGNALWGIASGMSADDSYRTCNGKVRETQINDIASWPMRALGGASDFAVARCAELNVPHNRKALRHGEGSNDTEHSRHQRSGSKKELSFTFSVAQWKSLIADIPESRVPPRDGLLRWER